MIFSAPSLRDERWHRDIKSGLRGHGAFPLLVTYGQGQNPSLRKEVVV
jgi:hypothetical protein